MDIDQAVKIVRETKEEKEVVPNLMIGFGIDEIQADYVAEIRLRHFNREYILKRLGEIETLKTEIGEMKDILADSKQINKIITKELKEITKKYAQPRKSLLYYPTAEDTEPVEEEVPDYPVHLFLTKEGYFKKIVPQSLRMSSDHKLKEGDEISQQVDTMNTAELLFFTDQQVVYKADVKDFEETKASAMGEYLPASLEMEEGENILYMAVTTDFEGYMVFVFDNGKAAKVKLDAYQTKTKRKKLLKAYTDKFPLVAMFQVAEQQEVLLRANNNRTLIFDTVLMEPKATRDNQGVRVMTMRKNTYVQNACLYEEGMMENEHRFRSDKIPSPGSFPRPEDENEQLTF